ncbi:isocitrate lyase ICL2 [Desulfuromonas carbonis]|uniref:isocitrate lyase ICL2 n=1 Tax=Desulfuromonas sp. DDH964 TaxID=1823759 RepID=UPI00078CE797|nr:isocitrate lyase ICL2 [Desulfuromonas sp. DDH964]AMV73622.1 Isocitrate lyase [Desulfuromonas sp. DDH964]
MSRFQEDLQAMQEWFSQPRFADIIRLYSPAQVVEQRGTIRTEYPIARDAAAAFHARLRELFAAGRSITTFGPYSPGQAVTIKRVGIEGIYLGGWATSAKGSASEDPGPDLASYPLSQVPDEAAPLVRALLAADRNQYFLRLQMTEEQRAETPEIDYRPFIIADADTGHGGDAHVRNLIRRFVEVGVPGYHIEDQKPGVKKCGHQAGKVLVPVDEQIKRLNAARLQLDIMQVAGIIVARTDAEAATYLDGRGDERDQRFILGATATGIPNYKTAFLAIMRRFFSQGVTEINGHLMYRISEQAYAEAEEWLERVGLVREIAAAIKELPAKRSTAQVNKALDRAATRLLDLWQMEASLKTYGQAVADVMTFHLDEGAELPMSVEQWHAFVETASFVEAREKARAMGFNIVWNCDIARTPEGYYQIQGGIDYAIAKSLAVAPFADILWMETKTADLHDARIFAEAIHAVYPDKMLAYNLSPSFNWDTTGMSEEEMRRFPEELGKLGFVFNFITYGGHQVDGLAAEEFATALKDDGMLALARLQRKLRLLDSPYRTPQTHVGGPRSDAGLLAASGGTATTKAMGKGSTQFQHLVETEVPPKRLEDWLKLWGKHYQLTAKLRVTLRPHIAGSELLELTVVDRQETRLANIIFAVLQDRRDRNMLSIRDQNTFSEDFRQKRLMTLVTLFLIHRYKAVTVHYVTPTEDNLHQAEGMRDLGLYSSIQTEIGQIIVAQVAAEKVKELVKPESPALQKLITKS